MAKDDDAQGKLRCAGKHRSSRRKPTLVAGTAIGSTFAAEELVDRIRTEAYLIWLREGCPDGRHLDHWLEAERICLGNTLPKDMPLAAE